MDSPLSKDFITGLVDAYLFMSDELVSVNKIYYDLEEVIPRREIEEALRELEDLYFRKNNGIILYRNVHGVILVPNPRYMKFLKEEEKKDFISWLDPTTTEGERTLLAYIIITGPKTLDDINWLFGGKVEYLVDGLEFKGFIEKMGKEYRISKFFLFYNNVGSINELKEYLQKRKSNIEQDYEDDFDNSLDDASLF